MAATGTYVLIASSDPFVEGGRQVYDLADCLVDHGDDVTVFLVQNGVLACRAASATAPALSRLAARVTTLADDFSLRERGIRSDKLTAGVKVSPIDVVVEHLAAGDKAIWH